MKSSLRLLCTFCVLIGIAISSPAATLTWVGGTGDWADPTKWDGGAAPGPNDIAVINSGTVTADLESTIAGLSLTGGILEGVGVIRITGPFNWSGGTMRGSGQTILETTSTGTISGGADKDLGRLMENKGALTWNQGRLVYRNGTFVNSGEMTIAHNGELGMEPRPRFLTTLERCTRRAPGRRISIRWCSTASAWWTLSLEHFSWRAGVQTQKRSQCPRAVFCDFQGRSRIRSVRR